MSIFEYLPLLLAAVAVVLRFVSAERPARVERPAEQARRPRPQTVSSISRTSMLAGKPA